LSGGVPILYFLTAKEGKKGGRGESKIYYFFTAKRKKGAFKHTNNTKKRGTGSNLIYSGGGRGG